MPARKYYIKVGQVYGLLTVMSVEGCGRDTVCKCTCGKYVTVRRDQLAKGTIKSCGCYARAVHQRIFKLFNAGVRGPDEGIDYHD